MTRFVDLFREGHNANRLDNGRLARSKAGEVLRQAEIVFAAIPDPALITNGVVMGIAFYSLTDLEFLDGFVQRRDKDRTRQDADTVLVFDVLSCKAMADFDRIVPGIGPVYQTPVVGIWRDGTLLAKGTGAAGRELLA